MRDLTAQERWWCWSLLGLAILCGFLGRINGHEPAGAWWLAAYYGVGTLFALLLMRVTYRFRSYNRWMFPLMRLSLIGTLLNLKAAFEKAIHG